MYIQAKLIFGAIKRLNFSSKARSDPGHNGCKCNAKQMQNMQINFGGIKMDQNIKNRFSVLPGYNHERDGIPIPQPRKFEYVLLFDDIVVDAGVIEAANDVEFERILKNDICPHFCWSNLTYKEVLK
jgi:hypothetical protein